jgi:hypothetical protein
LPFTAILYMRTFSSSSTSKRSTKSS